MKFIIPFIVFLLFALTLSALIINIPADYSTIQEGIDVSVDGDTVLVQPGTYLENINYNGKNITVASLFLTTQDTTYISQTVIDGSQPADPDSASVVIFCNGEDSTTVLTGFSITGGTGIFNGYDDEGGGIFCYGSSPCFISLIFFDNAADFGGGIFCSESSPSFEEIIIYGNSADWDGGGIYCYESSSSLVKVIISDNNASVEYFGGGGGIFCENSILSLENVTISGNTSSTGGGIFCGDSYLNLLNVTISSNFVEGEEWGRGGGLYWGLGTGACDDGSLCLINVIISNNYCSSRGGGIYFFNGDDACLMLMNILISENSAEIDGGGICCRWGSNPVVVNSILYNNSPQEVYFENNDDRNSITISYSDIQDGEDGIVTNNNGTVNWLEGNIDADPLFISSGDHPFSLLENSPCIDAGTPDTTGLNLPPWDIIGNYRIWDGDNDGTAIIDMGAYEYGAPPYTDTDDQTIPYSSLLINNLKNYPNPFNPITKISFSIKNDSNIELSIFNIKGQLVRKLINDNLKAGLHKIAWDGTDTQNRKVSSGVYYYTLQVDGKKTISKKMVLLK